MGWLANVSIRNKVVGIILITTVLVLGGGFIQVIKANQRSSRAALEDTTHLIARAVGTYSAIGLAFDDPTEATRSLAQLRGVGYVTDAYLFDPRGQLFAYFSRDDELAPPSDVHTEPFAEIRDGLVHCFEPVVWEGERYGTMYVRGTTEGLRQRNRDDAVFLGTLLIALIGLAVIVAFFLQGVVSRPILHLAERARAVSREGDFSVRVEKPGHDEIGVLYDGFNNMLAQIEKRQRELERSNRDLDQFAYVASHDLKAPLRAILSLSQWIEEDLDGRLPAETAHRMRLLRQRVRRMDELIGGILEYSRISRRTAPGEVVDVGELLRELIELYPPRPGFTVAVESAMPRLVTRRLRLQQVFANLINNALQHHDGDSGRVAVSARRGSSGWEFSVTDDGPGIADRHQEKIFLMFHTVRGGDEAPRDSAKPESTGLGLALVKKLVEEEGGQIHVESRPGEGSTFRFGWPAVDASSVEVAEGVGVATAPAPGPTEDIMPTAVESVAAVGEPVA